MTPFEINFLLHCYCRTDDFESIDAPIMPQIIEDFVQKKLIFAEHGSYRMTLRGAAHVRQLMDCQLPELAYVVGDKIIMRGENA